MTSRKRVLAMVVFLAIGVCLGYGQLATFDAMSYAVAIDNASKLYEQMMIMRQNLEYE